MKKTVIITLFLTSLVSCSNNTITEQSEKSPIITEATTAETTAVEIEIPPATERETINEVIYEDENVTIFYNGYDSFKTVQRVYITVENKTDNELRYNTLDFMANGVPIDENHGGKVEAHETASPEWTLLNSRFQEANITRVNKLEFKLHLQFYPVIEIVTVQEGGIERTTEIIEQYETDIITIER